MDLALSRAAQRFADGLARGVDRAELWPVIRRDLENANRGRFENIATAVVTLVDVRQVDPRDLVHRRLVDDLGIGVAQSAREGPQGGVTWVVGFLG